jgi:chloramphenicol O-acetyltransferase type A
MGPEQIIRIETWERQEQYQFFRNYDNPFFSVTVNLDVTELLAFTRANRLSFFAAYLYASQQQIHRIPEFRYRLQGDQVVLYEQVRAGSTVLKDNKLFTFCYFEEKESFAAFNQEVIQQVAACRQARAPLVAQDENLAQIHYSVLPWLHFSSVSHPRNYGTVDSIPKIVFGQYQLQGRRYKMPVAVDAHHALMDGYHVGLYFEGFQSSIRTPQVLLSS